MISAFLVDQILLYACVHGGQVESSTKGIGQRAFLHASQWVGQVFPDVHGLLRAF
jgi:hypothetical protein